MCNWLMLVATATVLVAIASVASAPLLRSRRRRPSHACANVPAVLDPHEHFENGASRDRTGDLRDYDRTTRALVAIEVWDASTRLPRTLLEALPSPSAPHSAAA